MADEFRDVEPFESLDDCVITDQEIDRERRSILDQVGYAKDNVVLNANALHKEAARQVHIFSMIGEAESTAEFILNKLKCKYDLIRAKLQQMVRNDPASFGISKVTETSIEAAIEVFPSVVRVRELLTEAKRDHSATSALKDAIRERGQMIRVLCDLYKCDYYSEHVEETTSTPTGQIESDLVKLRQRKIEDRKANGNAK